MILPRLTGFSVHSFRPIFSDDISLALRPGPNLILGGNGLGKTTLMQAIVYGLCGGSEPHEEKRFRWDHSYFRARLAAAESSDSAVDVAFALNDTKIQITRSLSGGRIAVLEVNGKKVDVGLDEAYADILRRHGGYRSVGDFAIVVTRLLYLPESRCLLAWDLDTQLRLLMLINEDVVPDVSFDRRRALLKNLDTRKRHTRVAINRAESQLASLLAFDENATDDEENEPAADMSAAEAELRDALTRLQPVVTRRLAAHEELDVVTRSLASISADVETLRGQIEREEAALVQSFLSRAERETSLAIQKLLQRAICPACGSRQERLQAEAVARRRQHLCVLCESDLPFEESGILATLQSQLVERLRAQAQLDEAYAAAANRAEHISQEERLLQTIVSEKRVRMPAVPRVDLPEQDTIGLREYKSKLEAQEAELIAEIESLTRDLDAQYTAFLGSVDARLNRLRELYTKYASAFLGLPCTLSEITAGDRFLDLKLFVPEFNSKVRDTEESCSEAQRFFLDIAFRMALIDLATEIGGGSATFLCETPESALDLSYIDNVVDMFAQFAGRAHILLLTTNIQRHGLAERLLATVRGDRRRRVVNLLNFGQLSDVQRRRRRELNAAVTKMVSSR